MWIYQAALQYLGPLQSHCDAVGEDKDQNHVVKQLMGYDGLTHQSEPGRRGENAKKYIKFKFSKHCVTVLNHHFVLSYFIAS